MAQRSKRVGEEPGHLEVPREKETLLGTWFSGACGCDTPSRAPMFWAKLSATLGENRNRKEERSAGKRRV